MRIFFLFLAVIISGTYLVIDLDLNPEDPDKADIRVLFIGNSITFSNDIPSLVKQIAESKNKKLYYISHALPGVHFYEHVQNKKLAETISSLKWDVVILQEQSQITAFNENQLTSKVYPYANQLISQVRNSNKGAKIVLYSTMAHRDGDQSNAKNMPVLGSYSGMQKRIDATYRKIARDNGVGIAPVGLVWSKMRSIHPEIELYEDDRHPNIAGAYLAGCVIFSSIFNMDCTGASVPSNLDAQTAKRIQYIADHAL